MTRRTALVLTCAAYAAPTYAYAYIRRAVETS